MSNFFSNIRREFDWHIKQWLRWSAPVVKKNIGSWEAFGTELSEAERERLTELRERY